MQVQLDFKGAGWLTFTLTHGPQSVALYGGYLLHTPRDLLRSLVHLLNDAPEERVFFDQEPARWMLRMRLLPGRLLRIEVHFAADDDPFSDPLGEPLFRHTEPAEAFATRVYREFERLVDAGLENDYGRLWDGQPFPRDVLDSLAHLLRKRTAI